METFCKLDEGDFLFPNMAFAILICIPWKERAPMKHLSFQGKGILNCVSPKASGPTMHSCLSAGKTGISSVS